MKSRNRYSAAQRLYHAAARLSERYAANPSLLAPSDPRGRGRFRGVYRLMMMGGDSLWSDWTCYRLRDCEFAMALAFGHSFGALVCCHSEQPRNCR